MDPKKKLILDQSKQEAAKAGRMFIDAIFGDTNSFIRKLAEEGDDITSENNEHLLVSEKGSKEQ